MSFWCRIGIHAWDGCICSKCEKTRDKGHEWDDCKCTKCEKTRDEGHFWLGCSCYRCYKHRDEEHSWSKNCEKCARCGKERQNAHVWNGCKCSVCGLISATANHVWDGCKCSVCGLISATADHAWDGCMCTHCGNTRDEGHKWFSSGVSCWVCGQRCDCDWRADINKCSICGQVPKLRIVKTTGDDGTVIFAFDHYLRPQDAVQNCATEAEWAYPRLKAHRDTKRKAEVHVHYVKVVEEVSRSLVTVDDIDSNWYGTHMRKSIDTRLEKGTVRYEWRELFGSDN